MRFLADRRNRKKKFLTFKKFEIEKLFYSGFGFACPSKCVNCLFSKFSSLVKNALGKTNLTMRRMQKDNPYKTVTTLIHVCNKNITDLPRNW